MIFSTCIPNNILLKSIVQHILTVLFYSKYNIIIDNNIVLVILQLYVRIVILMTYNAFVIFSIFWSHCSNVII